MKIKEILYPLSVPFSFDTKEIPADDVRHLLQSALFTAKGNAANTCEFYVTDDVALMERLAGSREYGAEALLSAPLVVAIVADRLYDGAWIENCSAAEWAIRMEAASMGLTTVAIQIRGYSLSDGTLSDEVVRGILGVPDDKTVFALLAVGYVGECDGCDEDNELEWERIHIV